MARWAVGTVAYRAVGSQAQLRQACFIVEAETATDAEGRGLVVARKLHPPQDGWQHGVIVSGLSNVIDPANVDPSAFATTPA